MTDESRGREEPLADELRQLLDLVAMVQPPKRWAYGHSSMGAWRSGRDHVVKVLRARLAREDG